MPAPASQPTWATDATFTNGGAGIAGTNTKVAPSGAIQAEGHVPGTPAPAQRVNWWKNLVGQWTTWLEAERARLAAYIGGADGTSEWVYPAVRARTIPLSPVNVQSGQSKIVGGAAAGVLTQGISLDLGWREKELALFGGGPGGTDTYSTTGQITTAIDQLTGYLDLTAYLRAGMRITSVVVYVDPGTAQATASDRVKIRLMKRDVSGWAGPTVVASGNADNTGNQQAITLAALTEDIAASRTVVAYWLEIISSAGASTTADVVGGIILGVNDPGPRNY